MKIKNLNPVIVAFEFLKMIKITYTVHSIYVFVINYYLRCIIDLIITQDTVSISIEAISNIISEILIGKSLFINWHTTICIYVMSVNRCIFDAHYYSQNRENYNTKLN